MIRPVLNKTTHTYYVADTFTVSLSVFGPGGSNTLIRENYIIVENPVVAYFSADPTSGIVPLTVQFTDSSTGTFTDWLWDFGDDSTSTEQNPIHTYNVSDTFTVSLTVTGPNGSVSFVRENYIIVTDPTIIQELSDVLPTKFRLYNNYPNPFNPSTTIHYELPVEGFVTLKVFDVLGRELAVLVQEYLKAGQYNVTFNAEVLPSGVYIYRLQTADFVDTKMMILMK